MPLRIEKNWKDAKGKEHTTAGAPEWKYLNKSNNICPGCKKAVYDYDSDVEYSKTKRGTHVFWHTQCTNRVWN